MTDSICKTKLFPCKLILMAWIALNKQTLSYSEYTSISFTLIFNSNLRKCDFLCSITSA